jgi:hypothetical protein
MSPLTWYTIPKLYTQIIISFQRNFLKIVVIFQTDCNSYGGWNIFLTSD